MGVGRGPALRPAGCGLSRRGWLCGAAFAGAGLLKAAPSAAAGRKVRAVQVAPDVWFAEGEAAIGSAANRNFISNAGFVVTDGGVVVVDALGSPALAEELIAEIRRVTRQPIRAVVLTHYHADHFYGLQAFDAIGGQIVAHPAGREYLNSETARQRMEASRVDMFPWIDESTRMVWAHRWVDAAETVLEVGSWKLHIVHVGPAHTPEDLAVWVPARGVLFAGDLVFRGRIPFVGQADSRGWIASLSRLIDFRPALLLPGHGPPATDPVADMRLTRDYLLHLRQTMGRAAQELEPFDEAYRKADWSRFEKMPLFEAANRMNAYNTYLLMEQQGR